MSRYESKDVVFDVPREWEDRSVIAFAAGTPPAEGPSANVVLTRESLEANDTLQSYADRQLVELAKRLTSFELTGRQEFALAGHACVELRFGWQGESGALSQRMLIVANKKRVVMNFTATSSRGEMQRNDALFDRIFSSIRFVDADPTGAPPARAPGR